MRIGQAPRSTKVRIDHMHVCTQEECLISEKEKYIKEIVAPEQENKGGAWMSGPFCQIFCCAGYNVHESSITPRHVYIHIYSRQHVHT